MYTETMKSKTSSVHVWKAKFSMYFFSVIFSLGCLYKNFMLPIYNLQYLRNESADLETPWGSNMVPPLTAFFNELNFTTLPLMSWIIYRTISNKHTIARSKRRARGSRKRASSFDSRRTLPTDIILQANEELQAGDALDFNVDKRRNNSYDKTRESTIRQTAIASHLETMPVDDDDESITNLTDNVEKYKRDT